jgi:hypothetical protein
MKKMHRILQKSFGTVDASSKFALNTAGKPGSQNQPGATAPLRAVDKIAGTAAIQVASLLAHTGNNFRFGRTWANSAREELVEA